MKKILTVLFILCLSIQLSAQQTARIASYNVHNYPNGYDTYIQKVISAFSPDALIVVEMGSDASVAQFLSNCLSSDYSSATAGSISSYNDCAFYYKSSVFTLISSELVYATTRDISEFKIVHNITKDTLIIFGVHLKANSYTSTDNNASNQAKRASAAAYLRTETAAFSSTANYLVCGDFNIFSSTETAFQNLVGNTASKGYFIDMMNVTGDWCEDSAFNNVCTYSTSDLDTRLDMILVSPSLMTSGGVDYSEFKIFGNDGNHFNSYVSSGTNSWFTDTSIGAALVTASDHLPIYADLKFGVTTTGVQASEVLPSDYSLSQNYPNPFNPSTEISYKIPASGFVSLKVCDLTGRVVASLVNEEKTAGNYKVKFNAGGLSSGVYFYMLRCSGAMITKKMVYLK